METSLRIPTPWEGAPVYLKERTGSTMDDALALARAGSPAGTTVVAGFQDRGRGRAPGRSWVSGAWESLLATVVLRRPDAPPPAQLPLRAGLAVSLAIEESAGIAVAIKWPNDLLWEGRKLAGILCESRGDILLVGIGVNCCQLAFPSEIAESACSLRQACGREITPLALLPLVLVHLKGSLEERRWREKVFERLSCRGQAFTIDGVEGTVRGIGEDGNLILSRDR